MITKNDVPLPFENHNEQTNKLFEKNENVLKLVLIDEINSLKNNYSLDNINKILSNKYIDAYLNNNYNKIDVTQKINDYLNNKIDDDTINKYLINDPNIKHPLCALNYKPICQYAIKNKDTLYETPIIPIVFRTLLKKSNLNNLLWFNATPKTIILYNIGNIASMNSDIKYCFSASRDDRTCPFYKHIISKMI